MKKKIKKHFDLTDSKTLGLFEDELSGVPMKQFTALNPKVYSFESLNKSAKVLKGISKVVVKKDITHNDYNNVLNTGDSISRQVIGFSSFDHQVYTVKTKKKALTAYYDKFYMPDNNNCLPYGYIKI